MFCSGIHGCQTLPRLFRCATEKRLASFSHDLTLVQTKWCPGTIHFGMFINSPLLGEQAALPLTVVTAVAECAYLRAYIRSLQQVLRQGVLQSKPKRDSYSSDPPGNDPLELEINTWPLAFSVLKIIEGSFTDGRSRVIFPLILAVQIQGLIFSSVPPPPQLIWLSSSSRNETLCGFKYHQLLPFIQEGFPPESLPLEKAVV